MLRVLKDIAIFSLNILKIYQQTNKIWNIHRPARFILMIIFLSSVIVCMSAPNTIGIEEWEEIKFDDKNDIKIYYKTHESGNIEFRGITHIRCSLNSLIALFSDSNSMPEWIYRLKSVERLKEIGNNEVYIHTIHSMPWPFKLRDSVVHSYLKQDSQSKIVTIHGNAVPEYIPKIKEYERITVGELTWKFKPNDDNSIEIIFQGYGEPGGKIISSIYRSSIFRWLVEMYLWQLPYKTLIGLKDQIKLPKYQNIKSSYIKELNEK